VAEQEISTAGAMLDQLGMALWSGHVARENR
jgi:hypothetical protein